MYEDSIIYIDKLYQRKKYTETHMKIIEDTKAVSPVVASLMLIMVVAGGAAFLSTIMQDVSSQTDDAVGKSNSADITSIKINIISSDLAMPAADSLVKAYNDKSAGVTLQLQKSETLAGTSNVSIGAVGTGITDIGVSDREPSPEEMGKYPSLMTYKLGTSGIVIIVNNGSGNPVGTFDKNTLKGFYNGTNTTLKAYQMTGSPGTEKAFLQYIGNTSINSSISAVTGSAGMLDALKNTPNSIGFIEYGYADSQDERGQNVHIAGILNEYSGIAYTNMNASNFTLAAASSNANNSYYPLELAHTFHFVTGRPSSLADSFIKWARSFEGQDIIEKNGYISYTREFN